MFWDIEKWTCFAFQTIVKRNKSIASKIYNRKFDVVSSRVKRRFWFCLNNCSRNSKRKEYSFSLKLLRDNFCNLIFRWIPTNRPKIQPKNYNIRMSSFRICLASLSSTRKKNLAVFASKSLDGNPTFVADVDIRGLAELSETFEYCLFSMLHLSAILTGRSRYYISLLFAFLMMLFLSV